jgi:type II secretory pathway component GspD/PulD (secretin)
VHLLAVIAAFGTLAWAPMKTREVRVTRVDLAELAGALRELASERGQVVVNARRRTVRVTDLPWEVDRLLRIVRAIDRPDAGDEKIWTATVEFALASEMAARLNELFEDRWPYSNETISAIVPDDRRNRLIIVANDRGYWRVRRMMVACRDPLPEDDASGPIELPVEISPPP